MKKSIIPIFLAAFVLGGCSNINVPENVKDIMNLSSTSAESTSQIESISDGDSSSVASNSDFIGTYIGLHGSTLILFGNNHAEYYTKEWDDVDTNATWSFENDNLTVHSDALGHDLLADTPNNNITSFTFTSTEEKWIDEMFVKVDANAESKNIDECIALIEEYLQTKITKPSDVLIIKAAGYVLEFPKEYVYAGNDEDTETYKRTDETAELGFYHDFLDEDSLAYINNNPNEYKYFAEEELAVILDDYLDNTDEVLTGMKYTDEIKPKGSIGNTYHYSMFCEDKSGRLYFSWFLNSATGEFAIFSLQDYDPDFKNSEEFLAAISNAVLE